MIRAADADGYPKELIYLIPEKSDWAGSIAAHYHIPKNKIEEVLENVMRDEIYVSEALSEKRIRSLSN